MPAKGHLALLATDGRQHVLGEPSGGPLLACFFKAECPTCQMLFPYLERLQQTYRHDGLSVWGVSQNPLDESLAFAAGLALSMPILLDDDWHASLAYGIETVPTLMLFDGQGAVSYMCYSFCKEDLNEIARLVSEQTGAPAAVIAPPDDGKPPFRPG